MPIFKDKNGVALTDPQVAELNAASTRNTAVDTKNIDYAKNRYGYSYTPPTAVNNNPSGWQEAPAGTFNNSKNLRYTGSTPNPYETQMADYYKNNSALPDEAAIRAAELARTQGLIDSINNKYEGIFKEQARVNTGNMGRTRSGAARGGLLGSDFGNAQMGETDQRNADLMAAREGEKSLELAKIFDKVDTRTQDLVREKTAAALGNQEKYLAYLKDSREAAKEDFATIAKTGAIKSLTELNKDDYNKLIEQTGYDDFTANAIFNANLPKKAQIDYKYDIQGNNITAYGIDPSSGEIKTTTKKLDVNVPQDYKPTVLPDGTLLFTPSKIDPSKPLEDQVLMYGAEGQYIKPSTKKSGGSGSGSSAGTGDQQAIDSDMEAIKGEDGYYDTAKYQDVRKNVAVNNPKLLTWFDSTYKPKVTLNPNDPTNKY